MTARLLALTHATHEGLGALADWLPAAGLDIDEVAPHRGDDVPTGLDDHAGLLVMGGPMGVRDVDRHPWLADEMALLRTAVAAGQPVLGVCLGAQLLAAALGGVVERARAGPEIGAMHVYPTPVARADPLFASVPPISPVVQWHYDEIVSLPPAAEHLASSPQCPHQAFRVGAVAWGLQFHVEASPAVVADWTAVDADALRRDGRDPDGVIAEVSASWADIEHTWQPVARRWAAIVGETERTAPAY
ncbi:MAG: type 1 glutamine amidotransferase [Mycobacteriales bacterium]|nr:type 1 glutamine amidotransferase [Frankia sp.]